VVVGENTNHGASANRFFYPIFFNINQSFLKKHFYIYLMKIALSQQNYHIGNFEANLQKILTDIQRGKDGGADIVLFSELCVCGYPPRDFLEFRDFIQKCNESIEAIRLASDGIAVVIGAPTHNEKIEGKDLHNSAFFISNQKIEKIFHKTLLPTYDVFDEYRYFEPNTVFECIEYKGKKIAVTICEDIWNVGNENPLYPISPMDELIKQKPDMMLNLSASPFTFAHSKERKAVLEANCERYNISVFYCNTVGAQTDLIFDGGSTVYTSDGHCAGELKYFEEDFRIFDFNEITKLAFEYFIPFVSKEEKIYKALTLGIRDYFTKLGFKKAVLGLSGGVDSALTCVLAVEALGAENVVAVMLPSQYSTDHSLKDAEDLITNLGCASEKIAIKDIFNQIETSLEPIFKDLPFNIAEENIQARTRGILLMALSNKFGYILLNTSNKSEASVGYGTLYGDMCGGISVLGDLYKMEVYALCDYINRDKEIIPTNTLTKAPSAELRPGQKDQDSLPEYEILDKVLYEYIENRKGPKELIAMGFDEALVHRILRMVNINEFKRAQTPPILRVSSKAFGMGRRMPIVGKYLG
jgi:NAD+ synthase (glutamine-hydrolysing)